MIALIHSGNFNFPTSETHTWYVLDDNSVLVIYTLERFAKIYIHLFIFFIFIFTLNPAVKSLLNIIEISIKFRNFQKVSNKYHNVCDFEALYAILLLFLVQFSDKFLQDIDSSTVQNIYLVMWNSN